MSGTPPKETLRKEVDNTICRLWVALLMLNDCGPDALTKEEVDLWDKVIRHRAVQDRLSMKLNKTLDHT